MHRQFDEVHWTENLVLMTNGVPGIQCNVEHLDATHTLDKTSLVGYDYALQYFRSQGYYK